jgi:hypothetical protein
VHENPSIVSKDITGDRDTDMAIYILVYVLNKEDEGKVIPVLM